MKKYKKKLNTEASESPEQDEEEEKIDVHSIEVVVERVKSGLIGSLRIESDINKPIFKKGDYVLLRAPSKLSIKDFVLYQSHEEYFLRRIIKYKTDDIYVAGDNEKEYRIIHREDVVGKVLSRERKAKRLSFSLTPKKRIYTFSKVNLAFFRLKNRVINYEQETNIESLELATQSVLEHKAEFENKTEIKYNIDLDSDLKDFLNPDVLVQELREAMNEENTIEEDTSSIEMEENAENAEENEEEMLFAEDDAQD